MPRGHGGGGGRPGGGRHGGFGGARHGPVHHIHVGPARNIGVGHMHHMYHHHNPTFGMYRGRRFGFGRRSRVVSVGGGSRAFSLCCSITCAVFSLMVSLPMVIIGALLAADIWGVGAQYTGYILIATGAVGVVGGIAGIVMALCGVCGPKAVSPEMAVAAAAATQPTDQWAVPVNGQPWTVPVNGQPGFPDPSTNYPAVPLQPPVYQPRDGPVPPSVYQQPTSSANTTLGSPGNFNTRGAVYPQQQLKPETSGNEPSTHLSLSSPPPRYYSPSPQPAALSQNQ